MPEAGATYVPRPLTDIESDPLTEAFAALVALGGDGRKVRGLAITFDGLTAHIAPGESVVITDDVPPSAYYVKLGAQVDKLMVNAATNYFYITFDASIVVNQTGIQPAHSLPLYSVPVAGGVAGTPVPLSTSLQNFGVLLKALGLDLTGGELTNLGAPLSASSGARLQDVTDAVANIKAIKNPARMASTANLTLSGLQTIDGVVGSSQDRVLVKNQTAPEENGIYVMLSGAWTRATDFDASAEAAPGTLVAVTEGTVNADALYGLDTNATITLGTTGLTFTRKDVAAHAALFSAHGSTSAATPSRIVERDAAGRAKFVAGAAAGDALIHGQTAGGVLTGTYPNPTFVANVVDNAALRQGAATSVIGRSAGSLGNVADIAAGTNGFVLRQSAGVLAFGQLGTESYVVNSVDNTVLADMAQARIKGRASGAGTGDPTDLTPAQGVTILNSDSSFDTQVRTSRLDQMAAPTASVNMNNQRLTNLVSPAAGTDGTNRDYVDVRTRSLRTMQLNSSAPTLPYTYATISNRPQFGLSVRSADGKTIYLVYNETTSIHRFTKSLDGGKTWSAPVTAINSATFSADGTGPQLVVRDDNTLYLLGTAQETTDKVFFIRSVDGGATWSAKIEVYNQGAATGITSGWLGMGGANVLYAACHGGSAGLLVVRKSVDNGDTWSTVYSAVASAANPVLVSSGVNVVVGYVDSTTLKTIKSDDAGATWSSISSGPTDFNNNIAWTLFSNDGITVYLAYRTSGGLLVLSKSTNRGVSWAAITHPLVVTVSASYQPGVFVTADGNTIAVVVTISTTLTWMYSTDAGATWSVVETVPNAGTTATHPVLHANPSGTSVFIANAEASNILGLHRSTTVSVQDDA